MVKLYENIKYYRKKNNWSQDELAKKMGYTDRSMIAKIEAGKVDLAQSKILDFAKVFGVDPGDLMGWGDFEDEVAAGQVDPTEIEKAMELYELYKHSMPKVQSMVDFLLSDGTFGEEHQ